MYPYQLIEEIRKQNPLIHNITNIVVANDSANGLLAIGASPFMSSAPEEMEEVAALASATVLNTGTLSAEQLEAMRLVGKRANELGKPVVIDPVGVGATTFRKREIGRLLTEINPTLIRGNAGEIAALADIEWQSKGVDAGKGSADLVMAAEITAKKYQTIVSVSGETDIVTDGTTTYFVDNGTPFFTAMTGAGCLLSCVCGAFLAADATKSLEAVVVANCSYAIAGEVAAADLNGLSVGSFRTNLLDILSQIDSKRMKQDAKIRRKAK
ncbi:hydroxyethylthiazole kinase [Candidatus Enterococcus clewellii]|uniref:Hydroxyethylthiazole kinase n=1 Tax=Candidatus Enterococcus clewellii TaxID=1834193 RepID=A0A242K717_9ENTE|nr:hydroxyethylthiazole kinase [Enterococcus sp. 9E7_DIV0242]OTP16112.1 hydroxyethylthiazole kinase [Enterococcus sp. 9E7_DIV0242]